MVLMCQMLWAQAEGEVESIGFGGYYRPECWVPMKVSLRSQTDAAAEMQIRVTQDDLDRDRVVQTRTVTLTPGAAGRNDNQTFWMYFRPQASDRGLQDASIDGSARKLKSQLKVVLTTMGGKPVADLPNTQQSLKRVDGNSSSRDSAEGRRMVLCVTDGKSVPAYLEYNSPALSGLSEEPLFVAVRVEDLPEDVRGYEMVDTILWIGAMAPDPRLGTQQPRFHAMAQYVKQGGMLVVCQGLEWTQTRGFESILPIKFVENRDSDELEPLLTMARAGGRSWSPRNAEVKQVCRVAVATAKPGAIVIRRKIWGKDRPATPYIVRGRVGSGCVTWVAQDLGEGALVRSLRGGWVPIWDEVLGWKNTLTELENRPKNEQDTPTAFTRDGMSRDGFAKLDMGAAFRRTGELGTRAAGYVMVAVIFFLVYWVVAGPGLYAWLTLRKAGTLNWFLFGVVAVVAAVLAMVMVRFVQSGSAELDHVTIVRAAAGEPASMDSQVSLLIRSDGMKELALGKGEQGALNWVTPYPEHPMNNVDAGKFLAMRQYELPIRDAANDEAVAVRIPWRSTTKRLQVRWTGPMDNRVEGKVRLVNRQWPAPDIAGTLVNGAGSDLQEIYLVYRGKNVEGDGANAVGDRVIYIPEWKKGDKLDLGDLLGDRLRWIGRDMAANEAVPRQGQVVFGAIESAHTGTGSSLALGNGWAGFWYSNTRAGDMNSTLAYQDAGNGYNTSLPLSCLYERVPPMRNSWKKEDKRWADDRRTILRVGMRWMDVSPAVASGSLVVIAQSAGPIPYPMTAEGEMLKGKGLVIYEFVLPIDRGETPAGEAMEK